MFGWFKRRAPEARAAEIPFGEAVASAFFQAALGSDTPTALSIGALETAAGLWSRGFAAAEVEGDRGALPAPVLAHIARDLCRRGESIHAIRVLDDGRVSLLPVGTWDVRGGPEPESWFYRADIFGASDHRTYVLPAASVIHVRYSYDAERPWLGVSPLARAHSTGVLSAWLERRLGEEASAAAGHLLPNPRSPRRPRRGGDR